MLVISILYYYISNLLILTLSTIINSLNLHMPQDEVLADSCVHVCYLRIKL